MDEGGFKYLSKRGLRRAELVVWIEIARPCLVRTDMTYVKLGCESSVSDEIQRSKKHIIIAYDIIVSWEIDHDKIDCAMYNRWFNTGQVIRSRLGQI